MKGGKRTRHHTSQQNTASGNDTNPVKDSLGPDPKRLKSSKHGASRTAEPTTKLEKGEDHSEGKPFPFLDLPYELRLNIYDRFLPGTVEVKVPFALIKAAGGRERWVDPVQDQTEETQTKMIQFLAQNGVSKPVLQKYAGTPELLDRSVHRDVAALLAINRQIESEFSTHFYEATRFVFWDIWSTYWLRGGALHLPPFWAKVRHLAVDPCGLRKLTRILTEAHQYGSFLAQMNHLESLTVLQPSRSIQDEMSLALTKAAKAYLARGGDPRGILEHCDRTQLNELFNAITMDALIIENPADLLHCVLSKDMLEAFHTAISDVIEEKAIEEAHHASVGVSGNEVRGVVRIYGSGISMSMTGHFPAVPAPNGVINPGPLINGANTVGVNGDGMQGTTSSNVTNAPVGSSADTFNAGIGGNAAPAISASNGGNLPTNVSNPGNTVDQSDPPGSDDP